jgi:integrase
MDELRAFLNYPFPTMRQRMVRDLFIFSFCCMGMNLTDIYQLQKKAVKMKGDTGEIKYIRDKTGKEIIVMMNAHATQLHDVIAPYLTTSRANVWSKAVSSSRYFAFDAIYNRYHTFSGNIQKIVRQVRTIMGFDDEFCFYTARHTWSTLMSSEYQLGQEYVDVGLGHSSKSVAANHYIAIDYDKLYEAHTDILQRLFEDEMSTTDLMEIEE